MDYDNDGILDFISGSYDPGDVYLFRGLGEGEYAKPESLLDENDIPLVHHPVEMAKFKKLGTNDSSDEAVNLQVASFGSWVAAVDWDADEDLDMLIGSFGGKLFLRENIGTREEPKYSGESIAIEADGKDLKESCHASPVVADWDGDGIFDLVIGSGDGSVGWYKNVGSVSNPKFGSRNLLVEPAYVRSDVIQPADQQEHASIFLTQNLTAEEVPMQGARAQICVCDYNKDGKLDLIVGDHSNLEVTRELSEKEEKRIESLKEKMKSIGEKLKPIQEKLYSESDKELEKNAKDELEEECQTIIEQYMKLEEERKGFFAQCRSASFVWLYLRNPDSESTFVSAKSEPNETESKDPENEGSNAPVSFEATLDKVDGADQLNVHFKVKQKWHLYANAGPSGRKEVVIELELPDGVSADGDWGKPAGVPSPKSPTQKLYKGLGDFSRELQIEPGAKGEIKVKISYQICNERMCLPPATEEIAVKID